MSLFKFDYSMVGMLKSFLHLSWLFVARLTTEKLRWRKVRISGYGVPRLYYGHDYIPDKNELSGGAIIKFQDLKERFPNNCRHANILYLVSSALPIFPEIMVREAKKNGVAFVLNQNGVAYPAWHGLGWEKTNRPMRNLLKLADYIIYQSDFSKVGADKFLGPCRVPFTVLHNPVDTDCFCPSKTRPSGMKILLAGTHQHFYRIQTAMETLKLLLVDGRDASLTIAGRYTWLDSEEECLNYSRQLAQKLGVFESVTLLGGYTQTEAIELFQKHHVLLHTQYNDCCPRLVVEAMACGLPIVYSESGGLPELVGSEGGVGVPTVLDWERNHPPPSSDLAIAVKQVFSSFESYSKAARDRAVSRFDVKPWIAEHSAIFKEVIEKIYLSK